MIIGFLFVLIIMGILVAISLYRYEDSEFSKVMGYSYFKLWTNKDIRLRFNLFRILSKIPGQHKILLNIKFSVEQDRMVDVIFVHTSGIYVMDLKEASGWIFGREKDSEWMQAIHGNKTTKFANPITENQHSILLLRQLLPKVDINQMYSLIVFSDGCAFNKIEIESNNVEVIKTNEVKKYLSEQKDIVLTKEQINDIYNTLEKYMHSTHSIRKTTRKDVSNQFS